MELKLNWTQYSKNELRKIFLYYKSKSNLKTATRQKPLKIKRTK